MRSVGASRWAILALFVGGESLYAAFERLPEGGRAAAMGGAAVAISGDPWALRENPSLAAFLDDYSLSFSHSPRWLGVPELARSSFVIAVPSSFGAVALSGTRFGFELYKETEFSVSVGARVERRFTAGVSVTLSHLGIKGYGTARAWGLDAGCAFALSPEITLGAGIANLNVPRLGQSREKLPRQLALGAAYRPVPDVVVTADLVRENGYPLEAHLGFECRIIGGVALRGGATDQPLTYSAGIGVMVEFISVDYGMTSHPDLGITHHFSVTLYPGAL